MRSLPHHPGLRLSGAAAAAAVLLTVPGLAVATSASADDGAADQSFTIKDPRITESSGLAASHSHPGIYWTHNDSDDGPYIYAVDSRTGTTVATITLRGIGSPRDVEAISLGPDGNLYVGDIGDNLGGSWDHVWIYRFPEPKQLKDATVRATQFTVKYADGPRDAEALMVDPKTGRVYIASKKEGGGGLYEGPAKLTSSGTNVFRRIGEVPWVTDGAFSPDGKELVLRSYFSARGYEWKNGRLGADFAVSAPLQGQSESVTFSADGGALMFGSEGKQSEVKRVGLKKESDSKAPSAKSSSEAGPGSVSQDKGKVTVGVIVLAVLAVLFLGFRRLRGRG